MQSLPNETTNPELNILCYNASEQVVVDYFNISNQQLMSTTDLVAIIDDFVEIVGENDGNNGTYCNDDLIEDINFSTIGVSNVVGLMTWVYERIIITGIHFML